MLSTKTELAASLRFQLSLLKLAVVPHGTPQAARGVTEADELARLAEKIVPPSHGQVRASE